jgi:biopolymer transport protein ExbD
MAQTSRGRRLMGEINVVPYIDVMLVLLIIFMITAPLLTQGVKVDLPKAGAEPIEPQKVKPLVLSIDRGGRLYLNIGDRPQASLDEQTVGARAARRWSCCNRQGRARWASSPIRCRHPRPRTPGADAAVADATGE